MENNSYNVKNGVVSSVSGIEKRLVIVHDDDVSTVNKMLSSGWSIESMASAGVQWDDLGHSVCYIYLVKNK